MKIIAARMGHSAWSKKSELNFKTTSICECVMLCAMRYAVKLELCSMELILGLNISHSWYKSY
jgi:hypothetical protein